MLKRLFCKHKYKYYNTKTSYAPFSFYGYNVFQFICPDCGKKAEIDEYEIKHEYSKLKSKYNKNIALGGSPVESSSFSHSRCGNCGICYESPVATLMIEKYLKKGIDLRELNNY